MFYVIDDNGMKMFESPCYDVCQRWIELNDLVGTAITLYEDTDNVY